MTNPHTGVMPGLPDFDRYCAEHNVQPEEMGPAFAAWLSGASGWDGQVEPVELGDDDKRP